MNDNGICGFFGGRKECKYEIKKKWDSDTFYNHNRVDGARDLLKKKLDVFDRYKGEGKVPVEEEEKIV